MSFKCSIITESNRMYKYIILSSFLFLSHNLLYAQSNQTIRVDLKWNSYPETIENEEDGYTLTQRPLWCDNCRESLISNYYIPQYSTQLRLGNSEITDVAISNPQVKNMEKSGLFDFLTEDFDIEIAYIRIKGVLYANIQVTPVRQFENKIEVLEHFNLQITSRYKNSPSAYRNKKDQTYTSILSSGNIHKIAVDKSGVFKITKDFLSSQGINTASIKLSEFKIYGNGGVMLPEIIASNRAEDLQLNSVYIHDENSNDLFDDNDYILWYAQGPNKLNYNLSNNSFEFSNNDYDDKAYYFIKWNSGKNVLIDSLSSNEGAIASLQLTNYDYVIHHESDEINHIHSGRIWWGDEMLW